ncbi:MAG: DnaB-like helicase C-terminal domain-containing protein [Prevotella sp.]|nr:DnaB-like helicase C-terminal domain-containing protein [Prevotella sp.]MDY5289784.1 DnaB-like helicase C-terminal domain-containing protein [Prevotella sp.]
MATKQNNSVLTEDFLIDLFFTCMKNDYVLAVVVDQIKKSYLPDRDFIGLFNHLRTYYKEYKKPPTFSILGQAASRQKNVAALIGDIEDSGNELETEQCLEQLENYIKQVRFQQAYKEAGELFNKSEHDQASQKLQDYAEWVSTFSLRESEFVDVIGTFGIRFKGNRQKHNSTDQQLPITRFYIDELDVMNNGRDLRTQLTVFLAPTGVGKSHAARWIGKNACQDGLNVLHFQLEGSRDEVVNAYSASLVKCSTFRYETGTIRDKEIEKMEQMLSEVSGKLYVKSYPKFNSHVSTVDIRNGIQDFKKRFGISPDVVIIDSIDLLIDSSGRKYSENGERHKRIAVANDLKDLAADENVWMVGTYQSTIENRDWLNDEKNVLTEFNTAEAKGLARPLTHLITLNQSDRERKEHTMRLFVAKSRFFEKGEPFRIATDYEYEQFYDRERSMNINKVA